MKICFLTPNVYPLFAEKKVAETAGGAELQQKYIGEALRNRGYEVSYVSKDYGQPDNLGAQGLRILKSYKPGSGFYGLRFFYPMLYKTWKALTKADADVYYVRCASYLVGIVALFSKCYGKKFIFAGAHENDFMPSRMIVSGKLEGFLYAYGLKNTDAICVQSYNQKQLLWDNFRLDGMVIRNFSPCQVRPVSLYEREYILWVSTIRSWKRPRHFLKLAEQYPQEQFVMIGGPATNDKYLYEKIEETSQKVDNLEFLGFQPLEIVERYFNRAKVLINTSKSEGFPNTFLHAWCRGVPVISCFDPDGLIAKHNLGFVVSSEIELSRIFKAFIKRAPCNSKVIVKYFNDNHSVKVIDKYITLLESLQD